jgi:UDP-N-acetylmuramate: L-alanyl-gamma-D-glutamyl-meso-diaminopimelate ligase
MRYYFLGIGGIAMASAAVLLKKKGHHVWGSDAGTYPPTSDFLHHNEIEVIEGFSIKNLERKFDFVVVGNAIARGNEEIEHILNTKLPFISMTELIRNEFISSHKNIVITGTHGKTTTTALMSWILECAGLDPSFLVGGITHNFGSSVKLGKGEYFIIEGDEYDSAFFDKRPKFIHYFADYLIINNIEFDHADIYKDISSIQNAFKKMIRTLPSDALIAANKDSEPIGEVIESVYSRLTFFGKNANEDWSYELTDKAQEFSILHKGNRVRLKPFYFPFPGEFQIQNALAAAVIANDIGVSWEVIATAFKTFKGVKRRHDYWGVWNGAHIYDDFAHHPTAIEATLNAMKTEFKNKRLIALFEPRTNTTVRHFFQGRIADSFSAAHIILIAPLHRLDIIPKAERLSIKDIKKQLEDNGKTVFLCESYAEIIPRLTKLLKKGDVLALLTNGSLGGYYGKIKQLVESS